jgi:hypothetical protein
MVVKPIKRGYKLWKLCDAVTGYTFYFEVYEGASHVNDKSSLGERVVLNLASKLSEPYHQLYYDNYFSSIPLLQKLSNKRLYGCGTIRTNRKNLPKDFPLDKNMQRGELITKHNSSIYVTKWKDNRSVFMAANFHYGNVFSSYESISLYIWLS